MTVFLWIYLLVGPALTLAAWIWLRSRREPVSLVEPMEIGRVIGGSFEAFSKLGWPMLLCAVVLAGVPRLASTYLIQTMLAPALRSGAISPLRWGFYTYGVSFGLRVISELFYIPAIMMLVARHDGRPISTGAALSSLPRLFVPVFLLWLLQLLGVLAGGILFILPAVILLLSWAVAQPVLIVEQTGIMAAFGRSRTLTVGSRGRILVALILFALIVGVAMVPGALVGRFVPGLFWPGTIYGAMVTAAAAVMAAGFQSSLYVELRRIRDGMTAPGLAEVFA